MKKTRLLAATAVASVAILALAGCVQSSAATSLDTDGSADQALTVLISGGENIQALWEDHLIPAFEEENPGYTVAVNLDLHGEHDAQTMAKLTSATEQEKDPGFDLVDGGFVPMAAEAGLLTPMTADEIPAFNDIPGDVVEAGGAGGIAYRGSVVLLAYDTATIPTPPKTLDELLAWIEANPGEFTYNSPKSGGSGSAFVATVLDKYVSEDARAKMTVGYEKELESEWTEGFETLRSLNPYIYQNGFYPNGNQQTLDLLASGEISMAPVWSDMFISGKKNGAIGESVNYTQIADPSFTGSAAYLGVPAASPRQEGALKLANFVLTPGAQEIIVNEIAGFPAISLDLLSADIQNEFEDADTGNLRKGYFSQMGSDLSNLWDQEVPGQ